MQHTWNINWSIFTSQMDFYTMDLLLGTKIDKITIQSGVFFADFGEDNMSRLAHQCEL